MRWGGGSHFSLWWIWTWVSPFATQILCKPILSLSHHVSFYQAIITRELQSTSIPLSRSLNAVLLEQLRIRIWWVCVCVGGSACCVGDMGWLFISRLMLRLPDWCRIDRLFRKVTVRRVSGDRVCSRKRRSEVSRGARVTPGIYLIRK